MHEHDELETRGAAVELLAAVGLGPEIEGLDGYELRMRLVTIEPGGIFGPGTRPRQFGPPTACM
jgi:hypothetical protein